MMETITNLIAQFQKFMTKNFEREQYIEPTYYNLVINDHITRRNKTLRFNYIKSAMDYVYELDLMRDPTLDIQIHQINHDGKNHVLRITTSTYVPEKE
jgi:hypothetical protein